MSDSVDEIHRCCSCNRDRTGENIMVSMRIGVMLCGECITSAVKVMVCHRHEFAKDYKFLEKTVTETLNADPGTPA